MLSYQHGYHAGNFADVIKHIALTHLLNYLTLKEKPLLYLETHSGKGLYDFKHKQAEKTAEYKEGVQLIWPDKSSLPAVFKSYIKSIQQLNPTNSLRYYPGSPFLAVNALRSQDRLYLCELHPREYEDLCQLPHSHKKVHFSHSDGIQSMNAVLPPPEKRGLIFIDPSFERKEEYKEIPAAIKQAYSRFATGVFCLWYPLVNQRLTDRLVRGMKEIKASNNLHIEFKLSSKPMEGMSGCGLWIINPPYTLAQEMKTALNTLKTYFHPGTSSYTIEGNS